MTSTLSESHIVLPCRSHRQRRNACLAHGDMRWCNRQHPTTCVCRHLNATTVWIVFVLTIQPTASGLILRIILSGFWLNGDDNRVAITDESGLKAPVDCRLMYSVLTETDMMSCWVPRHAASFQITMGRHVSLQISCPLRQQITPGEIQLNLPHSDYDTR